MWISKIMEVILPQVGINQLEVFGTMYIKREGYMIPPFIDIRYDFDD
jgi:hypothetical protein